MYARLSSPRVRAFAPGFVTAALVSLTLVSAACSDPTAPGVSPARAASATEVSATELSSIASYFPVLANAAVTCTDGNITGDVGTLFAAPTGSMTRTTCPLDGTVHLGDDASKQAYANFLDTYAALAPKADDVCTYLTGTLAGVTLSPGAYCFNGAATVTGILTLDGPSDGIWSFQVGSSGTGALTGTGFSVAMAGGGQACNVTWRVADATTMTTSGLQGHLMAGAAITLTGGTFRGSAWSKADVTITGTQVTSCG
jgi:hypothetical protein